MANFQKWGEQFIRKSDNGDIFPVTDKETLQGLKMGQLPYSSEGFNKPLRFAETSAPSSYPATTSASFKDQWSKLMTSALSNYQGVSNAPQLEERRQAMLGKQLLSPIGKYAPGGDVSKLGVSGALSAIKGAGSEYDPALQELQLQINQARQGDNDALNNLIKLMSIGKEIGAIGAQKRETSLSEVNGRRVLVDTQTGEIVKDLGIVKGESSEKLVKIPSTVVTNMTEGRTLPSVLDNLEKLINDNKNTFGILTGATYPFSNKSVKGAKSDKIKDDLSRAAQLVGKFLEGGKLAEGDINRYREMLPALNDRNYQVSLDKLNGVRTLIENYYNNSIEDLAGSGYDASGFKPINMYKKSVKETVDSKTIKLREKYNY